MGDALHLLPHPPLTASLERRRIFALTFIVVLHFNGHLRLLVSFFFSSGGRRSRNLFKCQFASRLTQHGDLSAR